MFDAVRNNKRIVQVFLAIIALPFALWGVDSYVHDRADAGAVATIGKVSITQPQFQKALRDKQESLLERMETVDAKLLNTPEFRRAVLDDLVDRNLLLQEAAKLRLMVGNAAVYRTISAIPIFQDEQGRFSEKRYGAILRNKGLSPEAFEAQIRQDMTIQQLASSLGRSGILAHTTADALIALQTEKREVAQYRLPAEGYLSKVKLADGAAKAYYEDHRKLFELPEEARVAYVVLSAEEIARQLTVSDADIQSWYENHKDRYVNQAEERRAAHILIGFEKQDKPKAREKAETVLAELKKNPAAFAELAKKYSEDPGSAAAGGDLHFFARGAMVKPFEEAVFSQKEGEISDLVESEHGFHIIRLIAIRPAKYKSLAEVKDEIGKELKLAAAARKFAESAEAFNNMVYEQADSLQPAAEKFNLPIQQSDWLNRQNKTGPLGNEKLIAAIFSEDALKNKRNTAAIEVAPRTLIAAHVLEYKPAALQAFDAVAPGIDKHLRLQEAQAMAKQEGEALLAELKSGKDKLAWGTVQSVFRLDPKLSVPPSAIAPIFRVDAAKLPGHVGVELPTGYTLFKVTKIDPGGEKLDETNRQSLRRQLYSLSMQEEVQDYLSALRDRYKAITHPEAVEGKKAED